MKLFYYTMNIGTCTKQLKWIQSSKKHGMNKFGRKTEKEYYR